MIGLRTNVRSEVALDCVKFFSSCRLKSLREPRGEERTLSEVAILSTYPMLLGPELDVFKGLLVRTRSASHLARHVQYIQISRSDVDTIHRLCQERPIRNTKTPRVTTDRGGREIGSYAGTPGDGYMLVDCKIGRADPNTLHEERTQFMKAHGYQCTILIAPRISSFLEISVTKHRIGQEDDGLISSEHPPMPHGPRSRRTYPDNFFGGQRTCQVGLGDIKRMRKRAPTSQLQRWSCFTRVLSVPSMLREGIFPNARWISGISNLRMRNRNKYSVRSTEWRAVRRPTGRFHMNLVGGSKDEKVALCVCPETKCLRDGASGLWHQHPRGVYSASLASTSCCDTQKS